MPCARDRIEAARVYRILAGISTAFYGRFGRHCVLATNLEGRFAASKGGIVCPGAALAIVARSTATAAIDSRFIAVFRVVAATGGDTHTRALAHAGAIVAGGPFGLIRRLACGIIAAIANTIAAL